MARRFSPQLCLEALDGSLVHAARRVEAADQVDGRLERCRAVVGRLSDARDRVVVEEVSLQQLQARAAPLAGNPCLERLRLRRDRKRDHAAPPLREQRLGHRRPRGPLCRP